MVEKARKNMSHYRRGLSRLQIEDDLIARYANVFDKDDLGDQLVYIYLYADILKGGLNNSAASIGGINDNWQKFLSNDETMLFALISKTNTINLRKKLEELSIIFEASKSSEVEILQKHLKIIKELVILVNFWHTNLLNSKNSIKDEIKNCIFNSILPIIQLISQFNIDNSQIKCEIADIIVILDKLKRENPIWSMKINEYNASIINYESIAHLYGFTKHAILTVFDQIDSLSVQCSNEFSSTLYTKDHDPHMGLIICFLQILESSTKYLSYIPTRYLLHIYNNVLGVQRFQYKPAKTIVNFELKKNEDSLILYSDTPFFSQADPNSESIIFSSTDDVVINKSSIQSVIIEKSDGRLRKESSVGVSESVEIKRYDLEQLDPKKSIGAPNFMSNPKLGFIVESSVLNLASGDRNVILELCLEEVSYAELKKFLQTNSEESAKIDILDYISKVFSIHISTQKSWMDIDFKNVGVFTDFEKSLITFNIGIKSSFPPISLVENDYNYPYLKNPSIKFLLNTEKVDSSFLGIAFWRIRKASIDIKVRNSKEFSASNDLGPFPPDVAIAPYGSTAMVSSKFYVNCRKILEKKAKKLSINIKWGNLPSENTNWEQYYNGYSIPIRNDSFKVSTSISMSKKWYDTSLSGELYSLFDEKEGPLSDSNIIDENKNFYFDIAKIIAHHNLDVETSLLDARDGTFQFELKQPSIGFGVNDYADSTKRNLLENVHNKNFDKIVSLNPPYSPIIQDISIDYQISIAKSYEANNQDSEDLDIYAITNLGYKKIEYIDNQQSCPLICEGLHEIVIEEANVIKVFIAFDEIYSTLYSIHFQILRSAGKSISHQDNMKIYYLANNRWMLIDKNYIVADTTKGFSQSGMIKFFIPKAINRNNTILSNKNFWLKILVLEDINFQMPSIVGVYNNAVEIEQKMIEDNYQVAPRQLVKYPNLYLPNQKSIKSVNQPFEFLGIKNEETLNQYIRRSQSLLKHRGRPTTASHFEEIILENFPEIFFVKCLQATSMSKGLVYAPGYISIIIAGEDFLAKLQDSVINDVEVMLKDIINPQVNMEIGFPYREKLKLVLNLQIDEKHAYGDYLGNLRSSINQFFGTQPKNYSIQSGIAEQNLYISDIYSEVLKFNFVKKIKNLFILKTVSTDAKDMIIKLESLDDCIMPSFPWSIIVGFVELLIYTNNDDFLNTFENKNDGVITDATIGVNFLVGPWENTTKSTTQNIVSKRKKILQSETFTIN